MTYPERTTLSENTRKMVGLPTDDTDDEWSHKECDLSRIKRDQMDVQKIAEQLENFQVSPGAEGCPVCI